MSKEFASSWVFEQYKNTAFGFETKQVLYSQKSKYQLVEIFDTPDWGRVLMLDGLMMITEKDEFFYHETITHLPMALKEGKVKKVLVIGAGDGGTVRELTKYSQIEKIDMVEIDEEVISASQKFLPTLSCALEDKRVNIIVKDAAIFIQNAPVNEYDLILADSSDPEGFAATLIETPFYNKIKSTLTDNGIFMAQSGSPLLQASELHKTWKNLNLVFPHCELAWSLTPSYPGSYWTYVLASKAPINKFTTQKNQVPNCKFWKPELLEALLTRSPLIESILNG